MFWLDWKLFGSGWGMASPYWDDVFYWLRDMSQGRGRARFYRWTGGFGAQLHSVEWFAPKAGTRRRLFGQDFVVFRTDRRWLRVDVAWARSRELRDADEIRALRAVLQGWGHGQ